MYEIIKTYLVYTSGGEVILYVDIDIDIDIIEEEEVKAKYDARKMK